MIALMLNELAASPSNQVRHHDLIPDCACSPVPDIIIWLWRDMADGGGYVSGRLTAKSTLI